MSEHVMSLYEILDKESTYALESKCRDLVFETYGKAKMACQLGAITMDQFKQINHRLIHDGVNNPEAGLK